MTIERLDEALSIAASKWAEDLRGPTEEFKKALDAAMDGAKQEGLNPGLVGLTVIRLMGTVERELEKVLGSVLVHPNPTIIVGEPDQ
jgi:hypothetical protein